LVRLESLIVLRDALRESGSLQQASDESGKRLEAALAAETAAQAELEKIQLRVADAQAAADVEVATASAAADTLLTKAKVAAAAIIAGANSDAAKIIENAKNQTAESTRRAQVLADAIKAAGS
jgi:hypothetical protein